MRTAHSELGITIDIERMGIPSIRLDEWKFAFEFLTHLEAGAIANPDEGRQVGHYWLRNPSIGPNEVAEAISESWASLSRLVAEAKEQGFTTMVMVGIGGSALGPQLLMDALGQVDDQMQICFIDNTDPDGMDRVFSQIDPVSTLVAVLSKSGGTKETRNGMLEIRHYFERASVDFPSRAIAVTVEGSALHQLATRETWFGILPLWSWVGGRTSITGMVGLLPLSMAGIDWQAFLNGAEVMDTWTRTLDLNNPAMLLAEAWRHAGNAKGDRSMVVLPYKDRLMLFGRYLQQLVMESLGKRLNMQGEVVQQGLTVYGNKGSTDQHAFIQQLREGPDDFFVNFIGVLSDRDGESIEVEPNVTAGDYLMGFLVGTRNALSDAGRRSLTMVIQELNPKSLGALIALFERAVTLYAARLGINAYHQPGVEAGKKAASEALALQHQILNGEVLVEDDDTWLIRAHLQANGRL